MKRQTFTIFFFVKKGKINKKGEVPIFVRLTVDNERVEIYCQRNIKLSNWKNAGFAVGKGEEVKEINERVELMRFQIYEAQSQLIKEKKDITALAIKSKITGEDERKNRIKLVDYFAEHNEKIKKEIGNGIAKGTTQRYDTTLRLLILFLKSIKSENILLKDVNPQLVKEFNYYLRVERKNSLNTAAKYCKNLGHILKLGYENELINTDVISKCKFKIESVEKPYLTANELQSIEDKSFNIDRLEKVKEIFLFACYTGLSYTDFQNLKRSNITNNVIKIKRQKTKIESVIPILPKALAILEKYNYSLPIVSNQKMNAYLKEIADLCGIVKPMTCHTARHTFATTVTLANGVSISSVSKMLGHTNLDMTLHYAKTINSTIINEMDVLSKKIS